jgi:uncharacterized protein YcnI
MSNQSLRRRSLGALAIATLLVAIAAPVVGLPIIPERELVADDQRQVIHVRIQSGCDELPTDQVEIQIPEEVIGVQPETMPGWTVETEVVDTEPYELFGQTQTDRIAVVRWVGGSVPADQYLDFGIDAVFRRAPVELAFPVTQRCGDQEVSWTEVPEEGQERGELSFPAPVLTVVEATPPVDVVALQETVDELSARADRLSQRVSELEEALEARMESPSPEP